MMARALRDGEGGGAENFTHDQGHELVRLFAEGDRIFAPKVRRKRS